MAVGAPALADPRYLRAVIEIAVRGLPHAFRDTSAEPGQTVLIDVSGRAGGQWTLTREAGRWMLHAGAPPLPTTWIRVSDDAAWKLFFNALGERDALEVVAVDGRPELAGSLLHARSVIV